MNINPVLKNFLLLTLFFVAPYVIVVIFLKQSILILFAVYLVLFLLFLFVIRTEIYNYRAMIAYQKDEKLAKSLYEKAISMKTKNANAYLNYAIILLREGNTDKAFEMLDKATKLNKRNDVMTDKNIRLTLGSCYWVSGNTDKAIEVLEELRSKYSYVNGNVLTTLGFLYYIKDDLEKAYEISMKALEELPENAGVWDNLGQIYFKQNKYDEATEAFDKALSFNPKLVDSLFFRGKLYSIAEDNDKAKEYFVKASEAKITKLNTVTTEQIENELKNLD